MKTKFTKDLIPEVIAGYNAYFGDRDDQLIGMTGEVTLANLQAMTAEISGAGIAGSYSAPVAGYFQDISQDIPFRATYPQVVKMMDPTSRCRVSIRGMMQVVDRSTGLRDNVPFRYVVGGAATALNPGSMQLGNPMGSTITISATYVLFEMAGEKLIEIDKLNNICVIDGKDVLEEVKKYC